MCISIGMTKANLKLDLLIHYVFYLRLSMSYVKFELYLGVVLNVIRSKYGLQMAL